MRTDRVSHAMNSGKQAALLAFVRGLRAVACAVGRAQWRLLFEAGATNKYAPAKHLNGHCGAAVVQVATAQVQEQIDGWLGNRANEFRDCVNRSSLLPETKHMLYAVNRRQAWFSREPVSLRGLDILEEVRRLARDVMRHCMGRHRRPDLSHLSPRLNKRIVTVAAAAKACAAPLWASFKLVGRTGASTCLHPGAHFKARGGEWSVRPHVR